MADKLRPWSDFNSVEKTVCYGFVFGLIITIIGVHELWGIGVALLTTGIIVIVLCAFMLVIDPSR